MSSSVCSPRRTRRYFGWRSGCCQRRPGAQGCAGRSPPTRRMGCVGEGHIHRFGEHCVRDGAGAAVDVGAGFVVPVGDRLDEEPRQPCPGCPPSPGRAPHGAVGRLVASARRSGLGRRRDVGEDGEPCHPYRTRVRMVAGPGRGIVLVREDAQDMAPHPPSRAQRRRPRARRPPAPHCARLGALARPRSSTREQLCCFAAAGRVQGTNWCLERLGLPVAAMCQLGHAARDPRPLRLRQVPAVHVRGDHERPRSTGPAGPPAGRYASVEWATHPPPACSGRLGNAHG